MNSTRIDANKARALLHFASKELGRYAINGVHLRPTEDGGTILEATDGKKLIRIPGRPWATDRGSLTIESKALALVAKKKAGERELEVRLNGDDGLSLVRDGMEVSAPTVEMDFPDTNSVMEDQPRHKPVRMDARLLLELCKGFIELHSSTPKGDPIPIEFSVPEEEGRSVLIRSELGDEPIEAVIMPMMR
jgi:hypothetical protein